MVCSDWVKNDSLCLRLYRSSKVFLGIRCNGLKHDTQRPDQEDCLQHWEQQMHHASVWILSWHCNSERISWSGIQRTWRWLEISLVSVGNNGPSDTDNLYSHLQRIQRDFDCCYWWLSKTFLYRNAKNYQFLIQGGI